jgi:adenylate cyclase
MSGAAHDIGIEAVREELGRILASSEFEASQRNRRFLTYVVEEALNGRADRIKAYSIATSVFGRGADFDPQLDSIVRIEAGRLRRALDRYYWTAGQADGVRITIPRGGYAPVFVGQPCDAAPPPIAPATAHAQAHRPGCVILVRPFEEEGNHSSFPNFSRGLTRQVIVGLTRFIDLFVFGPETTFSRDAARADTAGPTEPLDVDLLLTGGTTLSADRFTLEVLLSDARSGRYIWGETFERRLDPAEIARVRDEVANSVVRSLAQPYGVIFSAQAREVEGKPPESLSSYGSVLRFYQYWRTYDRSLIEPVRLGLEQAIRRDPDYAEAFACLSLVHLDLFRFGHVAQGTAAAVLDRARDLALRAVELNAHCSRGHHALALALWFAGDMAGAFAALRTGLSLNPNDTEIMSDLGLRHAVRMEWDDALPLLRESYARNPAQPGNYRIGLALHHYMHGRYRDALAEMRRMTVANVVQAFVVVAAAAARAGLDDEAGAAVQRILAIDPDYGDHVVADLEARNVHADIIAVMVQGLRQAGLPGRDTGVPRTAHPVTRAVLRPPVAPGDRVAGRGYRMSR